MRTVIFVVFICPLIMLVLSKLKACPKEEFTDTLYVPKAYQVVFHIGALIFAAMGVILGVLFGFQETVAHDILFAVCILLTEACAVMVKRHKVVIKNETLRMTPIIGRTRTVELNEITRFSEKAGIGVKVYLGEKKICTISSDCIGYKQFVEMLKGKNML